MNKLISFLFPVFLFGQFDQVANGFGLDIGSSGSGMFVTRHYGHTSEKFALNGELRFYDIKADDAEGSLSLIKEAFSGQNGTAKDIISLNAGAAIYVSGLTTSLQSGVDRANQALSNGSAQQKLDDYVKASNS